MQKVLSKKQIENDILNEGLWDSAKYLAAKYLPQYKVGGKIWGFGQNKAMKDMQSKIQQIIDSESKGYIKKLQQDIKQKNPNFPNNKDKKQFLTTVLEISQVYDTIMAAYRNKEITQTEADTYIANLRAYVNYILDYQLHGNVYGTFNEEIELGEDNYLTEADMVFEKLFGEATIANPDDISSASVKRGLSTDRLNRGGVAGYDEFGSTRIDTLKSNRLPLTLGAVGAVLTAAGWIGQSQWFIDYIEGLKEIDVKFTQDIIQRNIKIDPRGFSYTLQNNLPPNEALNLNFNQPVENLRKALEFYGNGDLRQGVNVSSLFIDPSQRAASVTNILEQLNDPSNRTIGDVFNTAEGTYGRAGTLFSQYAGAKSVIAKYFINRIRTTIIKTGAGAALGGALITAAPALLDLGIGTMVAGALVKLMRMKGLKSSRAATLNTLLQSLRPIGASEKQGEEQPKSGEEKPQGGEERPQDSGEGQPQPGEEKPQGGEEKPQGEKEESKLPEPLQPVDSLLRKLFQNIYNIRQQNKTAKKQLAEADYMSKKGIQAIGLNIDVNSMQGKLFIENIKVMSQLMKKIDKIDDTNLDNETKVVLSRLREFKTNTNSIYYIFLNFNRVIGGFMANEQNKKLAKTFLDTYMKSLNSTPFRNLKAEIEKNADIVLEERGVVSKTYGNLNLMSNFKAFYTRLYDLFRHLNKLSLKSQKSSKPIAPMSQPQTPAPAAQAPAAQAPAPKPKATKPAAQAPAPKPKTTKPAAQKQTTPSDEEDDFQKRANMGSSLEEGKKKTKYSKKASEFIGKEISHLKKDKGYPQDRAVAAAINVAKEKGMKVGSKKKSPKA